MKIRHEVPLRLRYRSLCVALWIALAAPGLVYAQDDFSLGDEPAPEESSEAQLKALTEPDNHISLGFHHVSDDSYRFGRFNGLQDEGTVGVLGLEYQKKPVHDSGDTTYFGVSLKDLGLDTVSLNAEYGQQGNFDLAFEFDRIQSLGSDSASTIFTNAGASNVVLPSNWVAGQTTATMSQLRNSLRPYKFGTERERIAVSGGKVFDDPKWDLVSSYRFEKKDGSKPLAGTFGNTGGNPRAVFMPEPIDWNTHQFDAALRYADGGKQFSVGYYLSVFENDNSALNFQNPYAFITGWTPNAGVGYPTGIGQLSLPPDNDFHQFFANGGWDVSPTLRLNGDVNIGRMNQNDDFLPYTINPTLAASITQPLPRDSLDGEIDTAVVNLRISSRPGEGLHWNASYRYDDRDNQTPRNEYVVVPGNSLAQDVSATSSRRRFNEPYSYKEHRFRAEGGFRFLDDNELFASAQRRVIDRHYSEVEELDDDELRIGLRRDFGGLIGGRISYLDGSRSGSEYIENEGFLMGYSPAYIATVPGGWENVPGLRRYNVADRERAQWSGQLVFTPDERWALSLDAHVTQDDYEESTLGLTAARTRSYSVDISYAVDSDAAVYAFFARDSVDSDQTGQSVGGGTRVTDAVNLGRRWFIDHRDDVEAIGFGFNGKGLEGRFNYGVDVSYVDTEARVRTTTGSVLTFRTLVPAVTRLTSANFYANYTVDEHWSVAGRFWVEDYTSRDWAYDGIPPDQLANVILLGEDSPDYTVKVISLSLSYRF